jgi:SAM-dependent methyltransferase
MKAFVIFFRSFPLKVILSKLYCKIFNIKIEGFASLKDFFLNKKGIEIGGPSAVFENKGYIPVYQFVDSLDGVNFSNSTVWEGVLREGDNYRFNGRNGHQFIAEGSVLPMIRNEKYDFVLSCNNLEHIANPIKALMEWKRILMVGGIIFLVLPKKESNFDHRRPFTLMDHLIKDYVDGVTEVDDTHIEEILKLHDLSRDPQAGSFQVFKERCFNNIANRCIHHHVFSQELLFELFRYCKMEIIFQYSNHSNHYIAAKKQ